MIKITFADLAAFPSAWSELCRNFDINNPPAGYVYLSEDLVSKFFPGEKPPMSSFQGLKPASALPREHWPFWVKSMGLFKTEKDRGIGDVIARTIGPVGGDAYKAWYQKTFGRSCGCNERQEHLNAIYPLNYS